MMKKYEVNGEQLALSLVKEDREKHVPRKRVDIVSLRLVKEKSLMDKYRAIRSPEDAYQLFKQFLGELDREYFVVMALDVKNQPTAMNICHIGSLNASIVHPREVLKTAILSNAASILVLYLQVFEFYTENNQQWLLQRQEVPEREAIVLVGLANTEAID